jgi:spermidine synthase
MAKASQDTASAAFQFIDAAEIPGGGALHLVRWGDDFSIQYDDEELMGSQVRHSEQALATLACERMADRDGDVLIGGLGMGFTLGAALAALGPDARVTVAELVPTVVAWARGPLAHIFGDSLSDPRASVEVVDVHDVIARTRAGYDAILLDVDNGPDGLIQLANDRLYCNWGLRAAHGALRVGGILAIWSSYADAHFTQRLEHAGFAVDEFTINADAYGVKADHTIWLAAKTGG